MRDALGYVLFPFLAVAFICIAIWEMVCTIISRLFWPPAPLRLQDAVGELPVPVFDPDSPDLDWEKLRREYVDMGVPFVLRRARGKPFSAVAPPSAALRAAFVQGALRVSMLPVLSRLPGLDELIGKLFPMSMRAYWPLWFLGRYTQGNAHIDLGPNTINCYFLRTGGKDVVLVPPEVTRHQPLNNGLDGLGVTGSEVEERHWLSSMLYYYRIDLEPQSLLVFNNSNTIHQFRNVVAPDGSQPEALSIRIKHTSHADPRVWLHLLTDAKMWWRFTTVFTNQLLREDAEDRDAKYL